MLEAYGQTDVGRRRKLNEDNFLVDAEAQPLRGLRRHGRPQRRRGGLARWPSRPSPPSSARARARRRTSPGPTAWRRELSFDGNRLKTAIKLANKRVFKAADNREDYTGMGTTVVAALVSDSVLTVGSAGDSRCYLFRDGKLTQLTRDDSWVSAAWAEGILTSDEIDRHPLRNVITKAVGAKDTIEIDDGRARASRPATWSCSARTACTR